MAAVTWRPSAMSKLSTSSEASWYTRRCARRSGGYSGADAAPPPAAAEPLCVPQETYPRPPLPRRMPAGLLLPLRALSRLLDSSAALRQQMSCSTVHRRQRKQRCTV